MSFKNLTCCPFCDLQKMHLEFEYVGGSAKKCFPSRVENLASKLRLIQYTTPDCSYFPENLHKCMQHIDVISHL